MNKRCSWSGRFPPRRRHKCRVAQAPLEERMTAQIERDRKLIAANTRLLQKLGVKV